MRIHSLEIIGFKSFYEKTSIQFHSRVNAVVGPNGCGKSNIIDAIRWVFGEQNPRRLRAEEMAEVISNGGESLKPLGMAEVALTIKDVPKDNFDEIVIKRRLYRSGESEYYINGTACRLKDITEMFMDTGAGARSHSIIGQGRVEQLITAKPEEKRSLIEEVGGIVKYKARRRETESRLESTKENLKRIRDIISEVNRQMQTLNRQARDAEKFKEISKEAREIELKILSIKLSSIEVEEERLASEKTDAERRVIQMEEEYGAKELAFTALDSKASPLEAKVEELEREIYKNKSDLQAKESLKDLIRNETSGIDEFIEKVEREIELLRTEKERIENQNVVKRESLEEVRTLLFAKESEHKEKETALSDLKSKIREDRSELELTRNRLFELLDKNSSLKAAALGYEKELTELRWRTDRTRKEIAEIEAEREKTISNVRDTEQAIEDIKSQHTEKGQAKNNAWAALSALRAEQENKSKEHRALSERLNKVSSRLNVLRQIQSNYEWLPEEIRKFLMQRRGKEIIGLVADFIAAPKGFEQAMEAAFGDKLKWAVVNEGKDALEAINSLRESSIGRSTFIPVQDVKTQRKFNKNGSDVLPITEIVQVHGIDRNIIDNILKGIFVVSSLGEALSLRAEMEDGASFVTMSGDFLDSAGAISGGAAKGGVFERKREIDDLSNESATLDKNISEVSNQIQMNQAEIEKLQNSISELEKELKEIEIKDAGVRKDIANLRDNLHRIERRYEIVQFELKDAESNIGQKETKLAEIRVSTESLQEEKALLEMRFKEVEDKVHSLEEEERSFEKEISNSRVERASLLEKSESIKEDVSELDRRLRQIGEKIQLETSEAEKKRASKLNLIKEFEDTEIEIQNLTNLVREREEILALNKNEKHELSLEIKKVAQEKDNLRQELSNIQNKHNTLLLRLQNLQIETGHIKESIQKIGLESGQATDEDSLVAHIEVSEDFDFQAGEAKLRGLKAKIEQFGPVNLLAPEEYKELEERHKFLNDQIEDLTNAMSTLKKAMNRIDRESEKRFKETFDIVNVKFGEIFSRLFRGGEAKLVLTNPVDIFETGVEVMARPSGKRFQSISLLSGGEKALSAIALVLSACFIKATPFLLFDEIDAPLDDVNTSQFTDLLKSIAGESQIIIITHNKKTMQGVDSLIGITSDKPGISKVVSVELRGI